MTTIRRRLAAALAAGAAGTAILLASGPGAATADTPDRAASESIAAVRRPTANADSAPPDNLAAVRRATAKYHDPAAALADGFVPTEECAAHPELGGMGLHYVNPARLGDPAIVATEPEVLLYEPQADGSVRLVGVEWFSVDPDQDLSTDAGRPTVLGVAFDGPMPGHDASMPVHFDLHAWIWQPNPAGMFAAWNPAVTC